ncbi:polysaccharide biosynthesis protein [Flavobacterium rhizosphaerae]|uniref:Membrane protein involved in the export of O-antigen and teichoic acid n=1 Tax=Flavobacterium rhizosphaerae TaxID=3163298 RepID=A0ABW8YXC1_9FLAO
MQNRKIDSGYFNSVKWGTYSIGISFLRQFLLVPAFMLTVGSRGYAFWIAISAIAGMICALNLGHLHYASNVLNLAYHKNHDVQQEMRQVQGANYFYLILQSVIGLVISLPLFLSMFTSFPVSYIQQNSFSTGFLFLFFGKITYQYCNSLLLRLFEPVGNIRITLKYRAIGELVDFSATALTIYFTRDIYLTCLAVFIVNILFSLINLYVVNTHIPFQVIVFKDIDIKKSLKFVKQSFVLNMSFLVEKIHEVGLNIIVVTFFRPEVLPIFSTSRTMTNIFYRFGNTAVIPLFPAIQKQFTKNNLDYIYSTIKKYWEISTTVIIACITIGLPFLPFIYTYWTKGKLEFNVEIVAFLFMAILFQNFGMIINEYFKKTNFSRQILFYNIIKSGITVLAIVICSYIQYKDGLGIALLAGEAIATVYLIMLFLSLFKAVAVGKTIIDYFIVITLFCASVIFYLFTNNYIIFLIINILITLYFVVKSKILNRS